MSQQAREQARSGSALLTVVFAVHAIRLVILVLLVLLGLLVLLARHRLLCFEALVPDMISVAMLCLALLDVHVTKPLPHSHCCCWPGVPDTNNPQAPLLLVLGQVILHQLVEIVLGRALRPERSFLKRLAFTRLAGCFKR